MVKKHKLSKRIRNNILVGLALVTPIGVTILIANWLFVFVTNVFLTEELETSGKQVLYRVAALAIVVAICFLIGFFARSFLGRSLYQLGDTVLTRLPVINRIYVQVRHISDALISQRQNLFEQVVMLEYPRRGLYSIGFVTSSVPSSIHGHLPEEKAGLDLVSLFIPTTPNPTSGLMIMAPRAELTRLPLDVTDAMRFIISAGAVHPGDQPTDGGRTLLDKIETWAASETPTTRHDPEDEGHV